jgi:hypothetical protein
VERNTDAAADQIALDAIGLDHDVGTLARHGGWLQHRGAGESRPARTAPSTSTALAYIGRKKARGGNPGLFIGLLSVTCCAVLLCSRLAALPMQPRHGLGAHVPRGLRAVWCPVPLLHCS